jgi:hypothetical protein
MDPLIDKISNLISKRHRVDQEDVKLAFVSVFRGMKISLQRQDMPKVIVPNFGTFRVKRARLDYKIKNYIKRYREGKTTYEDVCSKINSLWAVRKRLQLEEKISRRNDTRRKSRISPDLSEDSTRG